MEDPRFLPRWLGVDRFTPERDAGPRCLPDERCQISSDEISCIISLLLVPLLPDRSTRRSSIAAPGIIR